jgi:hypothetical protein
MILIFSIDKKKSIEVVDGSANQANSPTSSNEIELGIIHLRRRQIWKMLEHLSFIFETIISDL